jgi:amidophosphoribosyltransferase
MMGIHEECGVFGVISPVRTRTAEVVYYGLYALQHRGQESCGITVNDDGVFTTHKDLGLVGEVFTPEILARFPSGNAAVGHVRYATTGVKSRANCQPAEVNHFKGRMALCHNGNLANAAALRRELEESGAIFHSTSDTEIIAYVVTRERLRTPSIEAALRAAMDRFSGAYSLVLMSPQKLLIARDPFGFRPLCYGRTEDGTVVAASESCALTAVGASFVRDVDPGEILVFRAEDGAVRETSIRDCCEKQPRRFCVFETIYFARPDSVIDGMSIHRARIRAGAILAESSPVPGGADVAVGVPDSGLDAALGFSEASGIPYGIGLVKNKYIGRTFISPGQNERLDQVRIKLAAVEDTVRGKRVVLLDDSIVRGTTSGRIVKLLREAGAKEVHMRVSAPPFLHPCYYGTDIDSRDNLIACGPAGVRTETEIARLIGADSLGYLPLDRLSEFAGSDGICAACFTGEYPTPVPTDTRKDRFEQKISSKEGKTV